MKSGMENAYVVCVNSSQIKTRNVCYFSVNICHMQMEITVLRNYKYFSAKFSG